MSAPPGGPRHIHRATAPGPAAIPGATGAADSTGTAGASVAPGLPTTPGRRAVLLATALGLPFLAAGCKGVTALGPPPQPLPDVAVLRAAIAGEHLMIARYQAVMAHLPALRATLGPFLTQHRAHLGALNARLIDPRPTASPSATAVPPQVPMTQSAALGYLHGAESDAATRLTAKVAGAPPSLAQLFASVAASEASHAAMLAAHRRTG